MTTLCQDTMILGIITALCGLLNWAKATEEKTTEDSGESSQPEEEVQTLFVGDSHMKSIIAADLDIRWASMESSQLRLQLDQLYLPPCLPRVQSTRANGCKCLPLSHSRRMLQ